MTPKQYNEMMSKNPLWKMIYREPLPHEDEDDDFEVHARREKFQQREII